MSVLTLSAVFCSKKVNMNLHINVILCGYGSFLCPFYFIFGGAASLATGNISDKELRVIDVDGNQLGILSADEALKIAFEKDLDLVKIAPQATPPVCRIMDYGKFCFEQTKRAKEAKKNQKVIEIKEVRMSSTIDTHDFNVKVNQAVKFLNGGDKIKVSVRFKKRTLAHPQFGEELLAKFKDAISEAGVVDKPSKMEGRSLVMFVSPKVNK